MQAVDPILPGETLGVLGGGQLGRMFVHAAQALGYHVCVLDPDEHSPAGRVAERHLCAAWDDPRALDEMAATCRAVTTEFENVPAQALHRLAERVPVRPAASCFEIAQDRAAEKNFVRGLGIGVAPFVELRSADDFARQRSALDGVLPGILKVARLGYDGKGQRRVATAAEARAAWDAFGGVPCVLERQLDLAREVSCIVCRGADGAHVAFPVVENEHRGGILATTIAPARIDAQLAARATAAATAIAAALDYVGVLCVEFFVLADGTLAVNEMAPRPHNSGHATIDANVTSQFEQQARILAGLPLGDPQQLVPAVMLNLLGDIWFEGADARTPREPDWVSVLRVDGARLHLYGKREARRGRKMGHVTVLGATPAEALARAGRVAAVLGLPPPA